MRRVLCWTTVLGLLVSTSACTTREVGFALGMPASSERSFERVVWMDPIRIQAAGAPAPEILEVAWTYNAARYLRQRKLFEAVRIRPGEVAADHWLARVRIDRIDETARRTPIGVLLAPFAPESWLPYFKLAELRFEAEGTLELLDAGGARLASTTQTHVSAIEIYSRNESNRYTFFADQRRRFMDLLFEDALEDLP